MAVLALFAPAMTSETITSFDQSHHSEELRKFFPSIGPEDNAGVSVIVVQNGIVQHHFQSGFADVGARTPLTANSVFNIGSIAKQFTVFGVLLLRDDGKLSLDDDVRQYIPELPDYGQTVTLEHLARHTSGLRSPNYAALMGAWTPADERTHLQMLDLVRRQPELAFEPGTRFEYSNAGTTLLAEVIARVSGEDFPTFMKKRIYEPLEMHATQNRTETASIIPNQVHSYYWEDGIFKKALSPNGVYGYTNVLSTPSDLSKWINNFKTPKVGSEKSVSELLSLTSLPDGRKVQHRMGLYATPYRGYDQFQHTGSDRAFTSYLGWFPEIDLDIVVLSNVEGIDIFEAAYSIADLYLPEADKTVPVHERRHTNFEAPDAEALSRFTGKYWSDDIGDTRSIELDTASAPPTLRYVRTDGSSTELIAVSSNEFQMAGAEAQAIVRFTPDGMEFEDQVETSPFVKFDLSGGEHLDLSDLKGVYVSDEISSVYRASVCNEQLILTNAVREFLPFKYLKPDTFYSNGWFVRSIQFTRNSDREVTGFLAGNAGLRGVRFVKMPDAEFEQVGYDECLQIKTPARG